MTFALILTTILSCAVHATVLPGFTDEAACRQAGEILASGADGIEMVRTFECVPHAEKEE